MAEFVKVAGLAELGKRLRELEPKLARKHLKRAVVAGARLVRDEARLLAPVDRGILRKSVIVKYAPERSRNGKATYVVTVRRGKKYQKVMRKVRGMTVEQNLDAFYWRYLEFGTRYISPRPFMRPAFEMRKFQVVDVIRDVLRDGLRDVT